VSWLDRIRSDEQGATLALVAMSMAGFVIMVALIIDVGSGWLTRQSLVPASDAAALAAAQDLVHEPWDTTGACATAELYLNQNAPEAAMVGCEVVAAAGSGGRVTVTASETAGASLAPRDEGPAPIQSVSSVAWGSPLSVSALRPLAFCYDGSAELRNLIDNPPSHPTWVRVDFIRDDPAACGGDPSVGNFATVDFEHNTSIDEIRAWTSDGYPGQVHFDGSSAVNCGIGATCHERPYASSDLYWEMQDLLTSERFVTFPIYDYVDTDQVHLIGAIRARLYHFEIYGGPSEWFYELKVEPGLVTGTCCGPSGTLSGNQVIAICGVDPDTFQSCEPSAGA
jgi:hypothetical protein